MKHEIDLKNYAIRTDLAIEAASNYQDELIKDEYQLEGINVTKITLDEKSASAIGKKAGRYITIEFEDVTDYQNRENVKKIFSNHLKDLLKQIKIKKDATCFVVGLGNDKSTPDALGPLTIDHILVTNHLFKIGDVEDGFRAVSALSPGVTGETGLETSELIKSMIDTFHPDFVIVIDALASQSISRVNQTIQISDTGIHPGSGVGNSRKEISYETVGVPVVAIGVPTVVDAVTVVSDTIQFMQRFYAFQKDFQKNPASKMVVSGGMDYLKKEIDIDPDDRKNLFGIIGNFEEDEIKSLIYEVLTPIGYNLMITPKEIDFVIKHLSDVIGNGINLALHENVTHL